MVCWFSPATRKYLACTLHSRSHIDSARSPSFASGPVPGNLNQHTDRFLVTRTSSVYTSSLEAPNYERSTTSTSHHTPPGPSREDGKDWMWLSHHLRALRATKTNTKLQKQENLIDLFLNYFLFSFLPSSEFILSNFL